MRPGRIDRKFQYSLATKEQAAALFRRFYPEKHTNILAEMGHATPDASKYSEKILSAPLPSSEKESILKRLSERFASYVPENEFSTAELQGFLLTCKQEPEKAVTGVTAWAEQVREEREARKRREEERRLKKMLGTEAKGNLKKDVGAPTSVAYSLPGPVIGGRTGDAAPPNTTSAIDPFVGEPTTSQKAQGASSRIITIKIDPPPTTTPPAPDSPSVDLVRRRSSWTN